MTVETIIFDCDGVLVNTEQVVLHVELAFVEELIGIKLNPEEYSNRYSGMGIPEWIEAIHNIQPPQTAKNISPELLEKLNLDIELAIDENLAKIHGIEEFIQSIQKTKAVASNTKYERLLNILERVDLRKYFQDNIFSSDMVRIGKPDPALYRRVAEHLAVDTISCVAIEDSPTGIIAAKRAGMLAIGFVGSSYNPKSRARILLESGADGIIESFQQKLLNKDIHDILFQ